MAKIKFKNNKELECLTCSYLSDAYNEPMVQVVINTTNFANIKETLEGADLTQIDFYSENDILIGSYSGYTKYDMIASVLANFTLDIIINFKQASLQEKVIEIEKSNSDTLVRLAAIEQANTTNIDELSLDEYKDYRQKENNAALAEFLNKSSVVYNDKNYGVNYEDQTEMTMNLISYNLYQELGIPSILEWHAKKEQCTEFTKEQFVELIVIVKSFVYPYLQYCQNLKAQIYSCTSKEEITNIVIDYDSYTPINQEQTE